jgi:hypothetical protein
MFRLLFASVLCFLFVSCKRENPNFQQEAADPTIFHASVKALTDVIVHDIFSPPVASRIYAYSSIGAYEAAKHMDSSFVSLAGQIKHLPVLPEPETGKEYCFPMATTLTFLKIGKALIFSEDTLNVQIEKAIQFYHNTGMPEETFNRTKDYSDTLAAHILQWAAADNYKQTRSFPKYSIQKDLSTWKPTPPGYMDGIEPSWNKIRTFVMDSAAQFKPLPPTTFNMSDKNSQYYKEATEVYETVKNLTPEQNEIANFWDCNPYKLNVTGHIMHATKKISPGGHWINIIGLVCKKTKADITKSAQTYAMVSIALVDAFISCWDEKYRSNAVRPETVINEFIDPEWLPLLQTPPFPEYTSGHSVASSSAAVILTELYGNDFNFDDDTEVEFGLPVRSFNSFTQAAEEACISRLYGGIHFMPAIKNGITQGRGIGNLVVSKIKCRK